MTNDELKKRQRELLQLIDVLAEKKSEKEKLKMNSGKFGDSFIEICI